MAATPDAPVHEQLAALAGVPALVASTGDPARAAMRGTVLLLHGFTARKEVQRTEAHSLARHGYLAVTLDAVGHGERAYPDFAARFPPADLDRFDRAFFAVVAAGAAELAAVVAALGERAWAHPGRVGACGISMGGFTLLGAITAGCPLAAAVAIVASPCWRMQPRSPHAELDRYYPTPLLLHTGERDDVVAPDDARALHAALVPRYAAVPERLRYVEHAGEGHMFSAPAWQRTWADTLAWYDRFLGA